MDERLSAAQDELRLLREELLSYRANREAGLARKAVASLYYAAFHAVRALLYAHGLGFDAKTHEGIQRLVAAHFVKAGALDPKASKVLSRLEEARTAADYKAYQLFTEEDVEEALREAAWLVPTILALLQQSHPGAATDDVTAVVQAQLSTEVKKGERS